MRLLCQVNRATRAILIRMHPLLWIAAITLGALHMDARFRVIWPVGLMAAVGTILDQAQQREGRDRESRNRMTSDAAELVLAAVLATRSQQPAETGQGLRIAASAEDQSVPQPRRPRAG